ncbi:hypothetical protein W97_01757 [Coniosporium apollinis CBS 100218]|uniref:Uncharacterized protein n=1 Tax=Coniosporium apollinis (strain CBS 100218) TaxID=1168221 RepID=R7YL37_CONA1|nr:uncharacterized protein W97_01757 [Coniosporium apollinis CBS 100218]EON62534.1 hypothetical protein W97_01757 [Coniosporium apollinis CBS 100218]
MVSVYLARQQQAVHFRLRMAMPASEHSVQDYRCCSFDKPSNHELLPMRQVLQVYSLEAQRASVVANARPTLNLPLLSSFSHNPVLKLTMITRTYKTKSWTKKTRHETPKKARVKGLKEQDKEQRHVLRPHNSSTGTQQANREQYPLVGITRLICKIPKDQAELLEKPFSWYPGETGRASSFTNVPVAVLNELTSRLDKKSVQSTPPRASVLINVDYANIMHESEQDRESENDSSAADEPESASASSELDNDIPEDEDVPYPWGSSPAREKLPPDSSMPETASSAEAAALTGSRRVVPVLKPQARGSSSPNDEDVASKGSSENASDIEMSVPRALYGLARKKSSMSDAPSQSRVMRESKVQVAETPYAANRGQTREVPRVRHSRRDVARSPARPTSTVIANTLEISNSAPHDGVYSTANPDIPMSDNEYMRSDSDEQMLSQQLQHEMDAASHRSSLRSPVKPASPVNSALPQLSAVGNPLALRTSPFKLQPVPTFLPERFENSSAGAGSVSGKRGAENHSPLERQAKKSRRPARDFGLSQDEPVLQDPAITTRQTRREFLSRSLSAAMDTEPSLDQSTRTAATKEPAGRTGSTEMFDAPETSSEDSSHSATSDRVLAKRLQELDPVSKKNHRAPHEVRRSADSLTSGARQDEGTRFIVADVQDHERQPKLPVLQTSPDRASSSLVQQSLSGRTGLFQAFKATYADYQGDLKHFVGLCRRIDKLQKAQQMEHRALWDSFVIRHKTDYEPYLLQCMAEVEDPLPYEVYFKNEIEDLLHNKKILTPATLAAALREGSEATASSAVSPQIPAQPADYSNRRTNRDRSPNLPNFPHRSPHSESRTPRSRDDEEANRSKYQQPWLVADRYRSVYSARGDPKRLRNRTGSSAFEENREVRLATAVENGPEPTHARHASGRRSPEKDLGGRQSADKAKEEPFTVLTGGQERFDDTPRKEKSTAQLHSVQSSTRPIASTAPPQLTASSRPSGVSTSSRRPLPWERDGSDGRSNPPVSNVKKPVTSAQSVFKPPPSSMKTLSPVPSIPSNNLPPRPPPASASAVETHQPPDLEARTAGKAPRASLPAGARLDSSSIEGRNSRRKTLGGTPSSSTASGGPKKGVRELSMWSTLNQAKAKGK